MRFRKLTAQDLNGPADLPGFEAWLAGWGAQDRSALILAPPGAGKGGAVGAIAKHLKKDVVLCNMLELLDYEDRDRQLRSLLLACQTQRNTVVQLDKLSQAAEQWSTDGASDLGDQIAQWLKDARPALEQANSVVVFAGREASGLSPALLDAVDRKLIV